MAFGLFRVVGDPLGVHKAFCVVSAELKVIRATVPGEFYGRVRFATHVLRVIPASAVFVFTRCT